MAKKRNELAWIILTVSAGVGSIWNKIIIVRPMNKESKEKFDGKC